MKASLHVKGPPHTQGPAARPQGPLLEGKKDVWCGWSYDDGCGDWRSPSQKSRELLQPSPCPMKSLLGGTGAMI